MHNSNFTTPVKGHHFFHQRKGAPVKAPSQPYLSVCVLMGCGPKCWSHKKKKKKKRLELMGRGGGSKKVKVLNPLWQGDTRKVLEKRALDNQCRQLKGIIFTWMAERRVSSAREETRAQKGRWGTIKNFFNNLSIFPRPCQWRHYWIVWLLSPYT